MKVTPADIFFNPDNTPTSRDFDDVYFSNANGVKETDYVFIDGNDLSNRWISHNETHFCIAETGFGTGLNFFRTIQQFQLFRQNNPVHVLTTLIFISTEKHPLTKRDANNLYQHWRSEQFLVTSEDVNCFMQQWIKQYPIAVEGIHRRHFEFEQQNCEVTLDLHYGDAIASFAQIQQTRTGVVDAWFLDGFAPSKNDSMWTQLLYDNMAKLSKTGSTFATFTAAGAVKRGLIAAGFDVKKRKGFGKKREMLVGVLANNIRKETVSNNHDSQQQPTLNNSRIKIDANQAPYFVRSKANSNDSITIFGSGLAGAMVALKLTQQGKKVNLLWQGKLPADGASGNPIGGFYPQLNAQNNQASQIQLHSFLYACEFYKSLNKQQAFDHSWCGALQLAFNDNTQTRLTKLANPNLWPLDVARIVTTLQASEIANLPIPYECLYMPNAGWISPPSLVNACINLALKNGLLSISPNNHLHSYTQNKDTGISLLVSKDIESTPKALTTKALVIALGDGCEPLLKKVVPLHLTRGQVEMVAANYDAPMNTISKLQTLLCHKGYFTPAVNGYHALGSTYIKNDLSCDPRKEETEANFDMHRISVKKASWQKELEHARHNKTNYARAAIRCSTPDHLAIVGNVPSESQFSELADLYKALPLSHYCNASVEDNVFVLTGLGSRGLTTAPLMAEILVSQMLGKPMPLSKNLLDALNPNRFIVRSLIRRETW